MPTLTEAEITLVRLRTQDKCDPPDVSDAELQILYDDIPNRSCGCTSDIDTLIALAWDVRLAKASGLFDEDGDGGTRNVSQVFDHIKEMRDYWFEKCGIDTKTITIGSFDMGLDEDCEGSENSPYPYPGYWHWMGY